MSEAKTQAPTRRIVTNAATPPSRPGTHPPCVDDPSPHPERPPVERAPWRIPTDPPPV